MGVIASAILPVAGRCVACVLASSIMYRYRSIELSHSCQFPHLTHGLCNIHSHESHLLPSRSRTDRTGGLPEFADEISHGKRDERWMRKSIRLTSDCSSRNSWKRSALPDSLTRTVRRKTEAHSEPEHMHTSKYSMSSRLHVYLEAAVPSRERHMWRRRIKCLLLPFLLQSQCAETPSGLRWRVKVSRTKDNTLPLSVYSVQWGSRLLSFCQSSSWHWSITGREWKGCLGVFPLFTDDCFNEHFQAWWSALLLLYTKETKTFAVSRIWTYAGNPHWISSPTP